MSPGIMILAANVPQNNLAVGSSMPGSPETQTKRSESPGGYFTLSDSDGASATGNEPYPEEEPALPPKAAHQMYKIFRSPGNKALSESPPRIVNGTSKNDMSIAAQRSRSETPPRRPVLTRESSLRHSKTPPRPSPPKTSKTHDDGTPPRPPPPLSYTSTLPPPVPKKLGRSMSNTTSTVMKRNEASRFVSVVTPTPRAKPLQRVQPLQIQSPSVIKMLTSTTVTPYSVPSYSSSSSSEDNAHSSLESGLGSRPALPKKKSPPPKSAVSFSNKKGRQTSDETSASSFLKTFQKATGSRRSSTESLSSAGSSVAKVKPIKQVPNRKNSPPKEVVRKISCSSSDEHGPSRTVSAPKIRNVGTVVNQSKQVLQRKSSSPELSPSRPTPTVKRSSSQAGSFIHVRPLSRSTSNERTVHTQCAESQTNVTKSSRPPIVRRSSSNCFGSSDNDPSKKQKPYVPIQRKLSNASIKSNEGTTTTKRSNSNNSLLSDKSDKKYVPSSIKSKAMAAPVEKPPKKPSLSESFAAHEKVQRIRKAVALTRSNSSPKTDSPPHESVQTRLKNSIHSLIKFYETNTHHRKAPVVLEDKTLGEVLASLEDDQSICTAASGHLSQLSQLSAERLQSWLSNPLPSLDSKDFSLVEVDVLDQYVTDMLSFTKGALSEIDTPRQSSAFQPNNIHLKSNEELLDLLNDVHQSEDASQCLKISVQDMISRIEADTKSKGTPQQQQQQEQQQQQQQQPIILTKTEPTPTEEDLNRGVFTEVSFAGTFAPQKAPVKMSPLNSTSVQQVKLQIDKNPVALSEQVKIQPEVPSFGPVPSPRLKKKARKELMLLEHKEKGKEALSKLVKNLHSVLDGEQEQSDQNFKKQCDKDKIDGGLDSLIDDLCAHSAGVARDIAEDRRLSKAALVQSSRENLAEKVNVSEKKDHSKVGNMPKSINETSLIFKLMSMKTFEILMRDKLYLFL